MIDPEKVKCPLAKKFLKKEIDLNEYRELKRNAELSKIMLEARIGFRSCKKILLGKNFEGNH